MKRVTVFAPATVANVAVGFDILGFSFDRLGDQVTVERVDDFNPDSPISIIEITGVVENLPLSPELNTATVGLLHMRKDLGLDFGFKVSIHKGIPKGSGIGGSAASAVAAVVAANLLLDVPISTERLLKYALEGEFIASESIHADNIAPCLFGGLQLVQSLNPLNLISLPIPEGLECVLVHPRTVVETKYARKILQRTLTLKDHVNQSALLAGFIAGCYQNNLELIKASLTDILIEPQRARLITGFPQAKAAALRAGALGCSISGSGPTVFAWVDSQKTSLEVKDAMEDQFKRLNIETQSWMGKISTRGARAVP